ncbi:hypothetical protein UlMin_005348 [Ulmus minor]
MEVPEMEEAKKVDSHLTSAAAFVDGGIQDPCDDACSICLEEFSDSDPSTVTVCKHEFHFQCILEWCQRSSQCPMCWRPISLKDSESQGLLESVERERNFRVTPSRNAAIYRHPTLGDFELQRMQLPDGDAELEERIIQHLAAAAAMGRAHHMGRRESHRGRSAASGRPHFLVFSTHPSEPPSGSVPAPEGDAEPATVVASSPSTPLRTDVEEPSRQTQPFPYVQTDRNSSSPSGSNLLPTNRQGTSFMNRNSGSQSSPPSQDRGGPSELQSFSESLKSKFNAMSMRYKDSFSKSAKGWKERLFSRNNSEVGPDVRREVNAGIASVSRMMEGMRTTENDRASQASASNNLAIERASQATPSNNVANDRASQASPSNNVANDRASQASSSNNVANDSGTEESNQNSTGTPEENLLSDGNKHTTCATSSDS